MSRKFVRRWRIPVGLRILELSGLFTRISPLPFARLERERGFHRSRRRAVIATHIELLKQHKRAMIRKYAESEDRRGLTQILTTLVPYAIIWWAAVEYAGI